METFAERSISVDRLEDLQKVLQDPPDVVLSQIRVMDTLAVKAAKDTNISAHIYKKKKKSHEDN